MQIELLETFLDLIETGSFNRTADRLGITQSTVSGRIMALEAALGVRLFARSKAGTRPTPAGKRFLEHALAMRHEWNEARRAVQASSNPQRSLRIGMQNDLAAIHIGEWVSQFRKVLPDTAFYVELDYSTQMSQDLLVGELDLAVLFTPRHLPDLHFEMVGEIAYRMVGTDAARLSQISRDRYILANYSPSFTKSHQRLLPQMADAPIASGQNVAICGLLASLGGSAYVLEESARDLVAAGTCKFIEDAEPILQPVFFAVHVRNRHQHRKALAIVKGHFAKATAG